MLADLEPIDVGTSVCPNELFVCKVKVLMM